MKLGIQANHARIFRTPSINHPKSPLRLALVLADPFSLLVAHSAFFVVEVKQSMVESVAIGLGLPFPVLVSFIERLVKPVPDVLALYEGNNDHLAKRASSL
ncbi:MAG: hypothetical protein ACK41W_12310 [Cyanobacteriota bacterium]|jgi:hypothetical protein